MTPASSEATMKLFYDSLQFAPEPVIWINAQGHIKMANQTAQAVYGLDLSKTPEKPFEEIAPEYPHQTQKSNRPWAEHWRELVRKGQSMFEQLHRTHRGEFLQVEVNARLLILESESLACLFITDVTDRKMVEKSLEENEKRLLIMTSVSQEGVVIHRQGAILDANDTFAQMMGYPDRLYVIGHHLKGFLSEESWQKALENATSGLNKAVEVEAIRKDGSKIPLIARGKDLDQSRRISVFQDLSNLKESQKALKESERFLSTLVANMPGMVYRSKDDDRWTTPYAGGRCYELTGISIEELTSGKRSVIDIVEPEYIDAVVSSGHEAISEGRPYETVFPIKVNGKRKWIWERGQATGKDENGTFILEGFMTDITEQMEMQTRLQAALSELESIKKKLEEENFVLKEEINQHGSFDNLISVSKSYQKVLRQIEEVADTDATVLITGETGTGKEILARAIHQTSLRADKPMVKVNCAALPANLIESELFGHEKGAFTGAVARKIGRFELADKGTIFLDEIGELPLELQAKLLRVLQEGEFERLGSSQTQKIDVRIIAATNRNLEKMVEENEFRADLFYRLNVFPIHNIPLRERKEDIEPLVHFFAKRFSDKTGRRISKIPKKQLDKLFAYHWPGNIRELENVIERAVITSKSETLDLGNWFYDEGSTPVKSNRSSSDGKILSLEENERRHILKALEATNGRVSGPKGAARLLNINDRTLQSRIRKLGINRENKFY